jgi:hypothetical protein
MEALAGSAPAVAPSGKRVVQLRLPVISAPDDDDDEARAALGYPLSRALGLPGLSPRHQLAGWRAAGWRAAGGVVLPPSRAARVADGNGAPFATRRSCTPRSAPSLRPRRRAAAASSPCCPSR